MNTKKVRGAVIVTRVSTGEQVKHGTSMEGQREVCRAKAAAMNLPIIAEYEDAGISGAFLKLRAGMQAALEDIREGRADTLICANLSRYSRDVEHQQKIKKDVRAAGGRIIFCDMEFEDTPEGDMAFGIFGTYAEYERQVFRKRSMEGRRRRAEEGQQPSRSWQPFGYHIPTKADVLRGDYPAEELGKYLVVEEQAGIVRRLYASYAAGTHSLASLARELNTEGVPTPQGCPKWVSMSIRHILKNPVYTGTGAYGQRRSRMDEGRLERTHPRTGLPLTSARFAVPVPQEEWTIIPAPPLVDQATWDGVQERLAVNRSRFGGNPKRVAMLSGRIFCPVCGGAMFRTTFPDRSPSPSRPPSYRCLAHRDSKTFQGKGICVPTAYPVSVVEEATIRAIEDACKDREWVEPAMNAYAQEIAPADLSDLRRELAALDMALAELSGQEVAAVQAQIAGIRSGASPHAYAEVFASIAASRKDIEDRRGEISTRIARLRQDGKPAASAVPLVDMATVMEDVRLVLSSPDVPGARKRDMLGMIVEKVIAQKSGADVYFAPGLIAEIDTVTSTSRRLIPS